MKEVYTVEDLSNGELPASTKLAVIGYPISHSASPKMHQAALDALQLDMSYVRIEVEPGNVAETFRLMQEKGFLGCNVTIPHKLEAMAECDELSESAQALGVANTILFQDGKIYGDNTDGPGLVKALQEELDFEVKGSRILLLGAGGGAGKAIATQLAADGCAELYLSNRTVSKVEDLAADLARYDSTICYAINNSDNALVILADEIDLIINATSLGMKPGDIPPFPLDALKAKHKVYDAIYNPSETVMLKVARRAGAATANGLSMLVHQGALSFEKWTGQTPDTELMKSAIS